MKQNNNSTIYINTDGGSRGNPGPAAIGVVFTDDDGEEIYCCQKFIGRGTNNEAEYQAIITALEVLLKSKWFVENNSDSHNVICRLDSKLVVEQINGNWKIKQDHIAVFIKTIRELIARMKLRISFIHIPREQNKRADCLVNLALDEELKSKTVS
ncbi:MAG: ribonuclease HI family protein [Patescibacteria group bacterium]